ncbi:MAG TPA: cytochrome c oxidase subunit II, partial [Flavihumibacter sp.]|nr:cytochrome c oxidase subunit II [Flavihumibacter sp.]
ELLKGKILGEAASDHGEKVDAMLHITLILTGIVFFITQILLFWFSFKYQYSEKRKAYYFPHNNTLELIWTVVPAITLFILVGFGLVYWSRITGDAPANANIVEITGKQFGWIYRYPGKDKVFGKKYYKNINEGKNNQLGLLWDDKAAQDDIVSNEALYMVVNKPIKLVINSRDVVHDVGLVHFRMKMDAVPGTPTTMWFTPKFTTEEMKKKTGREDFEYEISCDQMCGKGHYSMKGIVKVVTAAEYALWLAKQKPNYQQVMADQAPAATPAAAVDTVKATAAAATHSATNN